MKKPGSKKAIIPEFKKMAEPVAESLQLKVSKIELVNESGNLILRFILEKPGGVTIKDCEKFSRQLSKSLDRTDLIGENYFLEVSSPGI